MRRSRLSCDWFNWRSVEIGLLHTGVPGSVSLKQDLPEGLVIRRCLRLHAKVVIIDAAAMCLGSANLTRAGLGAKSSRRRNFELGIWTRLSSLIDGVLTHFNSLWDDWRCPTCGRRDVCPVPLE